MQLQCMVSCTVMPERTKYITVHLHRIHISVPVLQESHFPVRLCLQASGPLAMAAHFLWFLLNGPLWAMALSFSGRQGLEQHKDIGQYISRNVGSKITIQNKWFFSFLLIYHDSRKCNNYIYNIYRVVFLFVALERWSIWWQRMANCTVDKSPTQEWAESTKQYLELPLGNHQGTQCVSEI